MIRYLNLFCGMCTESDSVTDDLKTFIFLSWLIWVDFECLRAILRCDLTPDEYKVRSSIYLFIFTKTLMCSVCSPVTTGGAVCPFTVRTPGQQHRCVVGCGAHRCLILQTSTFLMASPMVFSISDIVGLSYKDTPADYLVYIL